MGLETLVAAIDFIESQRCQMDVGRNHSGHHALPVSYSCPAANPTNPQETVSPAVLTSTKHGKASRRNFFIRSTNKRTKSIVPSSDVPGVSVISCTGNEKKTPTSNLKKRELHNALERCRRSDMRARLDLLRRSLPDNSPHVGQPCKKLMTTAATLQRAVCHIKALKVEETERQSELERLSFLKEKLEQQILDMVMTVKPTKERILRCPCPEGGVLSIKKTKTPITSSEGPVFHPKENLLPLKRARLDTTPTFPDCIPLGIAITPKEEAIENRGMINSSVCPTDIPLSVTLPRSSFISDSVTITPHGPQQAIKGSQIRYDFVTNCFSAPASFDFYGGSAVKVVVIPAKNNNYKVNSDQQQHQ